MEKRLMVAKMMITLKKWKALNLWMPEPLDEDDYLEYQLPTCHFLNSESTVDVAEVNPLYKHIQMFTFAKCSSLWNT